MYHGLLVVIYRKFILYARVFNNASVFNSKVTKVQVNILNELTKTRSILSRGLSYLGGLIVKI